MNTKSLYKAALWTLIGSVAISAVLGIIALLLRELDEWGARTLGTTLLVSATALLIMANSAAIEKRPRGYVYLSLAGLSMAVVALPIFLVALWTENPADALWKTAVTIEIGSIVAAHSALLTLWRLPSKYQLLLPLATAFAVAIGVLISIMIWAEDSGEGQWRLIGTLAILMMAVTIIVPVIPRLVALDAQETGVLPGVGSYTLNHCPNCGRELDSALDPAVKQRVFHAMQCLRWSSARRV
jgi:hypothetical protein